MSADCIVGIDKKNQSSYKKNRIIAKKALEIVYIGVISCI
jgi:hypothetical protein